MKIVLTAAAAALLLAVTTSPLIYHIDEYLIGRSQIVSAVASDPTEIEGSSNITIMVKDDPRPIVIETDGNTEDCALVLQDAIGNADVYVSIVSDNNAGTMNGFIILQCATFQTLNPRQQ